VSHSLTVSLSPVTLLLVILQNSQNDHIWLIKAKIIVAQLLSSLWIYPINPITQIGSLNHIVFKHCHLPVTFSILKVRNMENHKCCFKSYFSLLDGGKPKFEDSKMIEAESMSESSKFGVSLPTS